MLLLHSIFLFFIQNKLFKEEWIDIQVLDLVPLVLLPVFTTIPGCVQYCSSVVEFEVRNYDASRSSLIVQDCFGYPGLFAFPYEVEYYSFEVCQEFCWDFDRHFIDSRLFLVKLSFLLC